MPGTQFPRQLNLRKKIVASKMIPRRIHSSYLLFSEVIIDVIKLLTFVLTVII